MIFHMYHVPRQWLKPSGNTLVLFEEMEGDPIQISFATRQIQSSTHNCQKLTHYLQICGVLIQLQQGDRGLHCHSIAHFLNRSFLQSNSQVLEHQVGLVGASDMARAAALGLSPLFERCNILIRVNTNTFLKIDNSTGTKMLSNSIFQL